MRHSARFLLLSVTVTLGCTPDSHADEEPGGVGAGGGAGRAGAMATGGIAGASGAGGTAGGFTTLSGVDPATPLDQLTGAQLVQACNEFAQYFSGQVPNADIVRGNCVQDAVIKGKTTVADCTQASGECVAAAPAIPPIQCSEPAAGFACPATIALYQQCGNDLTVAEKNLYALLVCQSLEDPNIQQKLDAARAGSASCATFTQTCPSFFPLPNTGSGGAGGSIGVGGTAGLATGGLPGLAGAGGTAGGFTTLPGVDPATPLNQLTSSQRGQACSEYAAYFSSQVPDADIIRGNCVHDAVYVQNKVTVPECQQTSGACIAAAAPITPAQCTDSQFDCPASVALYQQCGTDLAASQKTLYALLVCESINDPNIQQKLDAANAPSQACTTFVQTCPSFFPTPAP